MKRHKYSDEEHQFIIDNVKGITLKELTERFNKKFNLNISENGIAGRKNKLGVTSGIVGGQFPKNHKTHNKGKKWDEYMPKESQKKSRKTTFKKGSIPPNRREIGEERIDQDGYTLIKIQDGHLNKNWICKHRYIYENMYGKIPKGYKVIFADGNRRNFDPNNLILVSLAEELIMNRNKLIKQDIELTKTGLTIAKMLNKIKKGNKK